MNKIWEKIKAFLTSIKTGDIKNIAITVLILFIIVAGFRGCSIYKQKIRNDAAAEQAEKDKKANEAISKELQKQIKDLLASVKEKDEANAAIIIERDKYKAEKEKIQIKYTNFMTSFSQLSQEGKDKELGALLKRNGIDVQVVAADNYIKIMPPEREDLVKFVSNAEKCAEDKANCEADKKKADEQVALLTKSENDLKTALEKAGVKCTTDKQTLLDDNVILNKKYKTAKKRAFWSKVGGVAGVVLAILLLK
jgi:arsenate reductase-like glutaredoxin family protein